MPDVDKVIHSERTVHGGGKGTFDEVVSTLPVGAMFDHKDAVYLVAQRGYLPWSFSGYGAAHQIEDNEVVRVLTPRSVVRAFAAGFQPDVHESGN